MKVCAFYTGYTRRIDGLGRVVLVKEFLRKCELNEGDRLMHGPVVDTATGRIAGLLLRPVAWAVDPSTAPLFQAHYAELFGMQEKPSATFDMGHFIGPDRPLDDLGRMTAAMEYRKQLDLTNRQTVNIGVVLTRDHSRIAGFLLVPASWMTFGDLRPLYSEYLTRYAGRAV